MYILGDTVGDVSAVDEEGPRRFVLKNTKAVNMFTLLIGITLMYSTPFVFGALGGVISERSMLWRPLPLNQIRRYPAVQSTC